MLNKTEIKFLKNTIDKYSKKAILSGNFLNQPSAKLYKLNTANLKFDISQMIEDKGFFIGLPTDHITDEKIIFLSEKLMNIDKFQ